jgi:hypothetical protein
MGERKQMKKSNSRRYERSLHGDITIDTHNNRLPKATVRYEAEAVRRGGRVWRVHADGSRSWHTDTVMLETALEMAEEMTELAEELNC